MDNCRFCTEDLEHCHATSVEHADGSTECLGDEPCVVSHRLHAWTVDCTDLVGGCACAHQRVGPVDRALIAA